VSYRQCTDNMTIYQHVALPELVTGYQLDGLKSFWMAAIPEDSENFVINPSIEEGTTGFTNSGFTAMAQSNDKSTGGFASLKLTPNGSTDNVVYFTASTLTNGTVYTWSVDIYGYVGDTYTLTVRDNSTPTIIFGTKTYRPFRNGWERVYLTFKQGSANPSRLQILVPGATQASHLIYLDRMHVAAKSYADTYVDGSERPYVNDTRRWAFTWSGAPHASKSKRLPGTIGGKLVAFETFGFRTSGVQGLGLGTYEPLFNGDNYGNYLTDIVRKRRQFTITGRIYGESLNDLAQKRQALINTLRPRFNGVVQPVRLFYQPVTTFSSPYGKMLYIDAILIEGLSGNFVSHVGEEFALVFQADDPYLYEYSGQEVASLPVIAGGTSKGIVEKNEDGDYSSLISGTVNGSFDCVAYRSDGVLVTGGTFTTLGGASLNRIALYDRVAGTWAEPTGGGLDGAVEGIAAGIGTEIGVVGAFTADDAATVIRRAGIHSGSTWSEMADGLNGTAHAIVAYPNGDYYVGGAFTASGTGTQLRYFARYIAELDTWVEVGTGFDDPVNCLTLGLDGRIYIGGDFLNSGDATLSFAYIAAYDPLTDEFDDLGGGLQNGVFGIVNGPGGFIYAVGSFESEFLGLRPIRRIGRWNGGNWEALANGFDNYPEALGYDGKRLYISGEFTDPLSGDFITKTDTTVSWDGHNWVSSDYYSEVKVGGFALSPSGKFAIAQGNVATGSPSYYGMQTVTVTNNGTAEAHPVFKISTSSGGFSYLSQIRNLTTGQEMVFDSLPIKTDVIIDCRTSIPKIYDETGGSLSRFVTQGASTPEDFRLVQGDNVLGFMAYGIDVTVTMMWPMVHWSIDGAVSNG
jgi:hypothetical protein